jgi:ribosomal protein S4
MTIHKVKPKLKKHAKLLNTPVFKKPEILFFSPDLVYLNPNFRTEIAEYFTTFLTDVKKLKIFFGFYRTALLKKFINKPSLSRRFLKDVGFFSLLERRLDVLLYRLGLVATLFEAKQLISHKKIRINNRPNSCFSRLLKKGDVISFNLSVSSRIKKRLLKQIELRPVFFHVFNNIEINVKTLKIVYLVEKISIPQQLHNYLFPLKCNNFI